MDLPSHHRSEAERYYAAGWWRRGAAPDHLADAARARPEQIAVSDASGRSTYGQVDRLVRRLAAGLWSLGVRPGDAVAIQLPNGRAFALAQQAAVRLGAAYVPLLPQLRLGDLEPLLGACRACVMITQSVIRGFDHAGLARDCRDRVESLKHLLIVGDDFETFLETPWEDLYGDALDMVVVSADAVRTILFTSGTEAAPKGVVHSYNTLFFGLSRQVEMFGFGPRDVVLCASPVGHATGAVNGVEFAFQIGGTVSMLDAWSPDAALDLIARDRCTLMWGAATFFGDLVGKAGEQTGDIASFKLALTAGAPIARDLVHAVRTRLGALLVAAYGQSEGQNIAINGPDDPEDRIVGSDGRIHDAIDYRVIDREFHYRGPNVCLGYLDPAHTAAAIDAEGFMASGDLVEVDDDRYLRVVGRRKEIIIRGGENISPAEVENILFGHPAIAAVSIVGYPDPRLGQRACAVVVANAGAEPGLSDLIAWMEARQVAKFKYPERLVLVDALPRTASGKVRKDVLRATLLDEGAPA